MKKRISGIILTVVMVLGILLLTAVSAFAVDTKVKRNLSGDTIKRNLSAELVKNADDVVAVEYYIAYGGKPVFTKECRIGENLWEQIKENIISLQMNITGHLYGTNGYFIKETDTVPADTSVLEIYAVITNPETEPDCGSQGHKTYYFNTLDGEYYTDELCTLRIEDIFEWLDGDGFNGAPTGKHSYVEGICQICNDFCIHAEKDCRVTYEWNDDYTKCTATAVCDRCKAVLNTETEEIFEDYNYVIDTIGDCRTKCRGHNEIGFGNLNPRHHRKIPLNFTSDITGTTAVTAYATAAEPT